MRRGFLLAVFGFGALGLLALILISPRGGTTFTAQSSSTASDGGEPSLEAKNPKETNLDRPSELPRDQGVGRAPVKEKTSRTEESIVGSRDEQHEQLGFIFVEARHRLRGVSDRLLSDVCAGIHRRQRKPLTFTCSGGPLRHRLGEIGFRTVGEHLKLYFG